jgi:NAD-dependent protein deacetylase/lipoamidase
LTCPEPRDRRSQVTDPELEVRKALQDAESVAILTGAGISAESGVPTFRGTGGLWRNYSPEQLATPEAFERDPALVWKWYDWRRGLIHEARPNAGHVALAELERRLTKDGRLPEAFSLITQNVDGLHDRAGSRHILKLHGDIWLLRCVGCGREEINEQVPLAELPPRCSCGALLRPGVVWFGEALPPEVWEQAEQAAQHAKVFMVIGTSGVVYPAAGLVETARRSGAKVVLINPEATALNYAATWALLGPSGEISRRLV